MSEPGIKAECFWCGRINTELQDDHVFPRSIGGTKELCVPSCGSCQTSISKAERELSRKSAFAMHLLDAGPRGRQSRKDPASGFIEAQYVLVPHPLGGYNETALKAGAGESPTALPYIEIEVANGSFLCRRRASAPSESEKLVATFERLLERKPDQNGLVAEVDVLTHDLGEIGNDPDFWPRIVLDLKGRLFIRARSPEEAAKFVPVFVRALKAGAFRDHSGWVTGPPIQGSTPHTVMVSYDDCEVRRVFAKIACSVAFIVLGEIAKELPMFDTLRQYALGDSPPNWHDVVLQIKFPGTLTQFEDRHVAALFRENDQIVCLISLFRSLHRIELGHAPDAIGDFRHAVATCLVNGTQTKVLSHRQAEDVMRTLCAEIGAGCEDSHVTS